MLNNRRDFPDSSVVKTPHFYCGSGVQSLAGELRSHMLPGAAKNNNSDCSGVLSLPHLHPAVSTANAQLLAPPPGGLCRVSHGERVPLSLAGAAPGQEEQSAHLREHPHTSLPGGRTTGPPSPALPTPQGAHRLVCSLPLI